MKERPGIEEKNDKNVTKEEERQLEQHSELLMRRPESNTVHLVLFGDVSGFKQRSAGPSFLGEG